MHSTIKTRYIHLDCLRGICAIVVFIGHLRALLFVNSSDVLDMSLLTKVFYFGTGFGHQAVIIFFVLSGFFVGGSIVKNYRKIDWSWPIYFLNRMSRLYIVLIPALLFGLIWDYSGILLTKNIMLYNGSHDLTMLNYSIIERVGWLTFIGNLTFLQEIFVFPYGSNGALWSLSYEFWYYIIFPLIFLTIFSGVPLYKRILYGLTSFIILIVVGQKISLYLFVWVMGTVVSQLDSSNLSVNKFGKRIVLFLSLSFFIVTLFIIRIDVFKNNYISDFLLGLICSVLIYSINMNSQNRSKNYIKFCNMISSFSYTLYLTHLPLLYFLYAVILNGNRWQPNCTNLLIGIFVFIAIMSYAYIFSRLTEIKTDDLRNFIVSKYNIA